MKETCEKVQKFWHKLGCERKAERVYEIWKGDKMRVSGNPWVCSENGGDSLLNNGVVETDFYTLFKTVSVS